MKNLKTVVIDCRFWGTGNTGLGRYTESLVTEMHRQKPKLNINLLVITSLAKAVQKTLPRFKVVPCSSRHYSLSEHFEIPSLINSLNPDLTHFLHFNVPLTFRRQFIVTIHDLIKHHSQGLNTTTKSALIYPLKRLGYHLTISHAINSSKLILTPSQWVKKDILNYYSISGKKIIVTSEAADKIYFSTPKKFPYPDYPYLIYVGNAYPHKNIIQLIKAVQAYSQLNSSNLKLIIVTARNIFYERLRQQIRTLQAQSVVKLADFTSDERLKVLYNHSLAFITASLSEGFGLPGLEAMASKTLVLSSDKTSLPEIYGSSAIYFDPENLTDLIEKISYLYRLNSTVRESLINQGFNHVQQFSWEKTVQQTLQAYENCLSL